MPSFEVFVSYSRHDAAIVTPIVKLLRLGEGRIVFCDIDSIAPGERWREQLEKALGTAQYVVVFWCVHASASAEVRREYEAALASGRKLVPVLLDRTPLPVGLGEYEWIDLSALAGADHTPAPDRPLAPQAIAPRNMGLLGALWGAVSGIFALRAIRPATVDFQHTGATAQATPGEEDVVGAMASRIGAELVRRARAEGLMA